jgi:hypothetical protein
MYLKFSNDTITYPYTIQQLREDNSNVSFPAEMSNQFLAEWDVFEINNVPAPIDYTKNITEGTPILIDGKWYQSWNQTVASDSEINYRLENQWFIVRETRNELLTECDWTQLGDVASETKNLWAEYRQSLRDITKQENPFNINWPVKP